MEAIHHISTDSEKDSNVPSEGCSVVPLWLRGPLAHRIYLCAFSLTLLWTTTLKVAIGIVGIFFNSPQFSAVHDTCESAYTEVLSQRDKYSSCVEREIAVCDRELGAAFNLEHRHSDGVLTSNAKKLDLINDQVIGCAAVVEATSSSLQQWSVAGGSNAISYSQQCTAEQMSLLKGRVKDAHEIKAKGMSGLRQYVSDTENTLGSVAEYSQVLGNYNKQYIQNHTEDLVSATYRVKLDGDTAAANAVDAVNTAMAELLHSVEQLMTCVGLANSTVGARKRCVSGRGMYDIYEELVARTKARKNVLLEDIQDFKDTLISYAANAERAVDAANDFYDAINGGRGLVRYLVKDLSLFGSSAELCGKSTPNWCSFSKESWFIYPPYIPKVTETPDLPDASSVWNEVTGDVTKFQQKLQQVTAQVQEVPGCVVSAVGTSISTSLSPALSAVSTDYDPPSYRGINGNSASLSAALMTQSQRGENITASILNTITGVSKYSLEAAPLRNFTAVSFSSDVFGSNSMALSIPKLSFAPFSAPKIKTLEVFDHVNTIIGVLFVIDSVYRLWLSVRVIRRHWSKALVDLPPCDVRLGSNSVAAQDCDGIIVVDKIAHEGVFDVENGGHVDPIVASGTDKKKKAGKRVTGNKSNRSLRGPVSATQSIVKLGTSFPAHVFIVLFFVLFLCYALVALYVPWYDSYIENCVDHSSNEGTFIGRNVQAMGLNFASSAGNERLTSSIGKYNDVSSSYCASEQARSKSSFVNQTEVYNMLLNSHQSTRADHDAFAGCVNISTMDDLFNTACCSFHNPPGTCVATDTVCPRDPLTDVPFDRIGTYLPSASCTRELTERLDSTPIFNCSKLPTCSTTCDGPHAAVIQTVSERCTCMTEWFFHASILYFSLAVAIYVSLNIARTMLVKGLVVLCWRDIWSERPLEMVASCSMDGKMLFDSEDMEKTLRGNDADNVAREIDGCGPDSGSRIDLMRWKFENPSINRFPTAQGNPVGDRREGVMYDNRSRTDRYIAFKFGETIRSYDRTMYYYFFLALCVNVPWIVSLFFFRDRITYRPHNGYDTRG